MLSSFTYIKDLNTIIFNFDGIFKDYKISTSQNEVESVRNDLSVEAGLNLLRHEVKRRNINLEVFHGK